MEPVLWRVEGEPATPHLAGWQQGLTLHLLFQPLTMIVSHRDGQTRRYLALSGCPTCRPDGCNRVCHRVLFEQLVRTTLPGVRLSLVPRLVPASGETRRVMATPRGTSAQVLDAAFLEQWAEGRLIVTLSRLRARPEPVSIGVMLAVSQDGPEPGQALRGRGWVVRPLAARLHRAAFQQHMPRAVPVAGRAAEALFHAYRDPYLFTGHGAARADQAPAGDHAVGEQPDRLGVASSAQAAEASG